MAIFSFWYYIIAERDFSLSLKYNKIDKFANFTLYKKMLNFIIRRLGESVLVMLGVLLLTFGLFQMAAGDPAAAVLGKNPKPLEIESLRRELKSDLLPSILDRSLSAALRYLNFKKRGIEARCRIEPTEDGRYAVNCTFTERKVCIFSQTIVVDTLNRAERMKQNFYERPEAIYRGVLALMAGNVNYLFD